MKWYKNSFRRCLVDMHIPDWDPEFFLAEFDSAAYIAAMKKAGVDAAYFYANSCVGLCNWPTKVGKQHAGLAGRDLVREITEGLRAEGIDPIVYINIWSKWAYENHPDWRAVDQIGRGTLDYMWNQPGRYGVCCFNSPYADYVLRLVDELCENYDFVGFWVDMILWRIMCYCSHCRKRFYHETGHELPKLVNWEDPVWHMWLRKREAWNAEFFQRIVDRVHSYKPEVTVMCNSSYYPNYLMGQSLEFFRIGEFIGGDYSMDRLGHSFECKFYNSVSANLPFEFLGSVNEPALNEHSIMKTKAKLKTLLFSTLANNGRYGFIDAIDPSGTLNPRVYQRMAEIFSLERKYEPFLRSEVDFVQDIGLYTNLESYINPDFNGVPVVDAAPGSPHQASTRQAALTFIENHIPFGVLTKYNHSDLEKHKILFLSDLMVLDDSEIKLLKDYVAGGGCLLATGRTGLYDTSGEKRMPGLLAELLGVDMIGETEEELTYVRPAPGYEDLLCQYTRSHPLSINASQTLVRARPGSTVLGYITLPLVDPKDKTKFASAISDPPGRHTDYPALVFSSYGEGRVIYSASCLETQRKADQVKVFLNVLQYLYEEPYSFASNAPTSVELTLYEQKDDKRYILNLLNIQEVLPNIPLYNLQVSINVPKNIIKILSLPDEANIAFVKESDMVRFEVAQLETFQMLALYYEHAAFDLAE